MSQGARVRLWGGYALFSRPETRVERCSYDVMTPSAARGMLEAICWHPGVRWVINKIYTRKSVQFTSIRRNEVKSKVPAGNTLTAMNGERRSLYISSKEEIIQRASILLRDMEYVVEAHFEATPKAVPGDNEGKPKDTIIRRLRRGKCHHQPYFECREFSTRLALYEEGEIDTVHDGMERDLGHALHDLDYSDTENIRPMFFRAIMKDGILDVRDCEAVRRFPGRLLSIMKPLSGRKRRSVRTGAGPG